MYWGEMPRTVVRDTPAEAAMSTQRRKRTPTPERTETVHVHWAAEQPTVQVVGMHAPGGTPVEWCGSLFEDLP